MKPPFDDVEAVTFDFYNTLVHHARGRGRGASLMEYLKQQRLESDPWEHRALYDIFGRHATDYAPDLPEERRRRYRVELAERAFQRLNVRAPEGAARHHAGRLWKLLGPAAFAPFPEVPEILSALRAAGYRLAVISNWQCGLEHFCSELGLGHAFDHVLASAEVGVGKPDPMIFHEACRRLRTLPGRVLHVGDSRSEDFEGGRAAGLQAVLLQRKPGSRDFDGPTIPTLSALPRLLGCPARG